MKILLVAGACAPLLLLAACSDALPSSSGASGGRSGTGSGSAGAVSAGGSGGSSAGAPGTGGFSSAGSSGGTTPGGSSNGGSSAGVTSGGSGGTAGSAGPSGLPVPPGTSVPQPAGTPGNLTVLNWAGFEGAVSYTFDDALGSQISNYDALQATGVRMTFYVVSNNNGSNAIWSQAALDGHELGNHTAHHCQDDGSGCAWGTYAGSLAAELEQCSDHITQAFGQSGVWTAAAPYGDGGYASAAEAFVFLNRGVQGGQIGPNDATDPFSLPCQLATENQPASAFNAATDSARAGGKWQIFLIHSLGGDGGYNPISLTELVSSVDHAKSLGDVWIDSVVNVGAYWVAQKLLSSATPVASGSDQTWSWALPANFPPGKYLRVRVDGGTLKQGATVLPWDQHGYYEVALDAGSLTLSP